MNRHEADPDDALQLAELRARVEQQERDEAERVDGISRLCRKFGDWAGRHDIETNFQINGKRRFSRTRNGWVLSTWREDIPAAREGMVVAGHTLESTLVAFPDGSWTVHESAPGGPHHRFTPADVRRGIAGYAESRELPWL
ncbi:hypothetical protein ACQP2F_45790 [Actinoplanes sp. CA-030573]|uniref:hypothetical protein n=1 Tax=Actinoplanes sp. CA-030573 TaxID=3239898 RepID=UPI003D916E60